MYMFNACALNFPIGKIVFWIEDRNYDKKMNIAIVNIYEINLKKDVKPVWKNSMELVSAKPDCLFSSSGADYKAWSGAGQNCNVFVRSATSQRLASHKP